MDKNYSPGELGMITQNKFLTTQEYRVYPSAKQRELINQTLGCCRFVYNWNLAKHINSAGWGEFVRQLEYKSRWSQHCSVIIVNRFYPSSKLCSVCDTKNGDLKLNQRMWTCSNCNTEHDRDINAAVNLRRVALKAMSDMDLQPGTVVTATAA